jgi:hypothetical protein
LTDMPITHSSSGRPDGFVCVTEGRDDAAALLRPAMSDTSQA